MALDKIYYLNVGPGGTYTPSGDPEMDSQPQDVDKLIVHLSEQKQTHLALYFHGGLVNSKSGMNAAVRITHLISATTKIHPVAFVWETGLGETVVANLADIHQTKLFKKLLVKVIKIAGKKLGVDISLLQGARGVGKLTDAQIETELATLTPFNKVTPASAQSRSAFTGIVDSEIERELREEVDNEITNDAELELILKNEKSEKEIRLLNLDHVGEDDLQKRSRGILSLAAVIKATISILVRVIKRSISNRDHGFYPTIIEEILREFYVANAGAWVWKQMKDKAEDMWKENTTGIPPNDMHVGTHFIESLSKYGKDTQREITLDLIGHSAGSIVIAHLLKKLSTPEYEHIKIRHVLFMAPAITCELFDTHVRSNANRFRSFRMFTMSDEYEKKDWLLSVVYPRSLLYFISGVLEREGRANDEYILGLQRHILGNAPYDSDPILVRLKQFLDSYADSCVYAITLETALDGLRSGAVKHGAFDDDSIATLASITYILNQP